MPPPSPNAPVPQRFDPRSAKPTANPRRVVGGIRLSPQKPGETSWVTQRWMRLVESVAPGEQLSEGLEYARLGQTRSIDLVAGHISGRVQGRMPRAYTVAVRLPTYTHEQWGPVIDAMVAQARYAATLLSGELPSNIEDLVIPVGLKLFPSEPSDVALSCTCSVFTGIPILMPPLRPMQTTNGAPPEPPPPPPPRGPGIPWCKHICCLMALVADRLASDPFMIFLLRGLPPDDLVERLRQRRAATGVGRAAVSAAPIYTAHLPGVTDRQTTPLRELMGSFWGPPPSSTAIDLPLQPPEVSHPLLRRMGASPFPGAKFPLVGLLATCYDLVTESAVDKAIPDPDPISDPEATPD